MPIAMIGPKFYVFDSNGKTVAGAKINTYETDGVTRKETFNAENGASNSNPVITNSAGYAEVYLDGVYAIVVTDADDELIWSQNPVTSANELAQAWINKKRATFATTSSFTIAGNYTSIYKVGRRVQLDDSTMLYGSITGSSYSAGVTTVTVSVDGSTPLSASLDYAWVYFLESGDFVEEVANIAALRGINGTTGYNYVYVQSHTDRGDGGHGSFRWVSGAAPGTYTDNNGTIIVPTGGDGSAAWLREYDGVYKFKYLTGASDSLSSISPWFSVGDTIEVEAYSSLSPKRIVRWVCTSQNASLPGGASAGDVTGAANGALYIAGQGDDYYKFEIAPIGKFYLSFFGWQDSVDAADILVAATKVSATIQLDDGHTVLSEATVTDSFALYGSPNSTLEITNRIFADTDGLDVVFNGIVFDNCGKILQLGSHDYGLISFEKCKITGSTDSICLASSNDIDRFVFVDNILAQCTCAEAVSLNANIKQALVLGNKVDGITSSTNSCIAFNLGKTEIENVDTTGDYVVSNNLVQNIISNGSGAGEVHAMLLYGSRVLVTENIIKNIDRPNAKQAGGVEGIYLKSPDAVVANNVCIDAGRSAGSKGFQIGCKGPHSRRMIITGNVVIDTDKSSANSDSRNGILASVSGTDANDLIVSNNYVQASLYGIVVSAGALNSDNEARGIFVVNNQVIIENNDSGNGFVNGILVDGVPLSASVVENVLEFIGYAPSERAAIKIEATNNTDPKVCIFNVSSNDIRGRSVIPNVLTGIQILPGTDTVNVKSTVLQGNKMDNLNANYRLMGGDTRIKGIALLENTSFDRRAGKHATTPPSANLTERGHLDITNA